MRLASEVIQKCLGSGEVLRISLPWLNLQNKTETLVYTIIVGCFQERPKKNIHYAVWNSSLKCHISEINFSSMKIAFLWHF